MAKKFLFNWIENFWLFLNCYFKHFNFEKIFYAPPSPIFLTIFDCHNAFHAVGVRSDPLLKPPIFLVGRFNLHFFHTKLNFQQLLFCSSFEKTSFRLYFATILNFGRGVRSDPPPAFSPYMPKNWENLRSIYKIGKKRLKHYQIGSKILFVYSYHI